MFVEGLDSAASLAAASCPRCARRASLKWTVRLTTQHASRTVTSAGSASARPCTPAARPARWSPSVRVANGLEGVVAAPGRES